MSTRSNIGIEKEDEAIQAIYCHFDGYLDGVGATLNKHYQERAKVEALIALGNISSLEQEVAPPEGTEHSYRKPHTGVTVAYVRDRGEDWEDNSPITYPFLVAWERADPLFYEYLYLFDKEGVWWVAENESGGTHYGAWRKLSAALAAEAEDDEEEDGITVFVLGDDNIGTIHDTLSDLLGE